MPVAAVGDVHVDENAIVAFVADGLPPDEMSRFRHHLDNCPDCMALVAAVIKDKPDFATTLRVDLAAGSRRISQPRLPSNVLSADARVGPYVIERLLGTGGMGVVYAARDSRLDRTVALKLIRREAAARDALAERLRRESKLLARLSHPNVTVVYELGTADDEIYIAMEFVDGTNLRVWLHDKQPSARDIIAVYTRAGRGLAAAHAAGLVHRDFKPDNVLLADSRTVKVTDFGLARLANDITSDAPQLAGGSVEYTLTMTGAVVGTPAYMAPEQLASGTIDARVDQFAFCVSLYEALYRERPFKGDTFGELRESVRAGRVEVPRSPGVPARVRRALLRGLATDRDKRFPTMDALLEAIAPRRGRVALAVLGVGAVSATALAVMQVAQPTTTPCHGASTEIAQVWNATRRAAIHDSFLATHAPEAKLALQTVEQSFDKFVGAWTGTHTGACEATRVHREQSEAVLDLRMACLARQRADLDALVSAFSHADKDTVAHARDAIGELGDVTACSDLDALGRRTPLPTDPVARAHYAAIEAGLSRGRALVEVGHYREADALLASYAAQAANYVALDAELSFLQAKIRIASDDSKDAEPLLVRALNRAQAARLDEIVAHAAVDLAHIVGYRQQRAADGLRWVDFAAATIAGKGGDDPLSARLESVRASIFDRAGEFPKGEAAHRKALAAAKRIDPGGLLEGEILDGLGENLAIQGKLDEAVPIFEQAVALRERAYGPTHSLTTASRANFANALSSRREYARAADAYAQALAAREAEFGPDSLEVARLLSNFGQMLQESGKLADASQRLERALAIRERVLGRNDRAVARTLANLGYVALDQHDYKQAVARFERADAIVVDALGADHFDRADALEGLGAAWLGLRPAAAIAPLEQALAISEKAEGDPVTLAGMQSKLACALWKTGKDRARAKQLAAAARPVLVEAAETDAVSELDATLKH